MGTYSMPGNKKPGGSGNETGANLPPSLTGWVASLEDINWAQLGQNLDAEKGKRAKKKRIRKKMREGEKVLYGEDQFLGNKREKRQYEREMNKANKP